MIFIMKIITRFFHTKWQVKYTKLENANFVLNKYRNNYFCNTFCSSKKFSYLSLFKANKKFLRMIFTKQKVSTTFSEKNGLLQPQSDFQKYC